jgi:hypothetical protein
MIAISAKSINRAMEKAEVYIANKFSLLKRCDINRIERF